MYCKHTRKQATEASTELKSKEKSPKFQMLEVLILVAVCMCWKYLLGSRTAHVLSEQLTSGNIWSSRYNNLIIKRKRLVPLSLYALLFNLWCVAHVMGQRAQVPPLPARAAGWPCKMSSHLRCQVALLQRTVGQKSLHTPLASMAASPSAKSDATSMHPLAVQGSCFIAFFCFLVCSSSCSWYSCMAVSFLLFCHLHRSLGANARRRQTGKRVGATL